MKYYIQYNVLYNYMDGAFSAHGAEERRAQCFGGETWEKEDTWQTQA
jgi:hypothetical protein